MGQKLGKKALLLGAIAQSIPDIDFVASFWMDTASNLLAHRGFTHSFLFIGITSYGFAFLSEHFHRLRRIGFKKWLLFFIVQMLAHIFIDLFNNYGVGILEPFNHHRFSWNALYVADPFFTIWPLIAFAMLLIIKPHIAIRRYWWQIGIFLPFAYLVLCSFNKISVDRELKAALHNQDISYNDYLTTPTPLNNFLWYIVVQNDSGYNIGFRSVFDQKKLPFHFSFFPRNNSLLHSVDNQEEVQHLLRFSQGYYTVERWHDTLVFNDLRFGQIIGWRYPKERFVFHYFLRKDLDNKLVVQRGRFANWDASTAIDLFNRIRGN